MSLTGGAGALLSTEVAYAELGTHGTHGGRRLRGRVERRLLQVAVGRGGGFRMRLGRLRPVAVEVIEAGERRYEVAIEAPPDPWLVAGRRLLLTWLAAALLVDAARTLRGAGSGNVRGGGPRGAV